jgi:4-diphosphocytidyl-2C-methyl-D-erythritol kinase
VHVSTPDAYKALNREAGGAAPPAYLDPADWAARGVNDFEGPVFAQYPQLKAVTRALKRAGAATIRMSGSGSSIFSVFSDETAEALAVERLKGIPVHPIRFISRRQYQSLWWNCLKRHTLVKVWPPQSRYEQ